MKVVFIIIEQNLNYVLKTIKPRLKNSRFRNYHLGCSFETTFMLDCRSTVHSAFECVICLEWIKLKSTEDEETKGKIDFFLKISILNLTH